VYGCVGHSVVQAYVESGGSGGAALRAGVISGFSVAASGVIGGAELGTWQAATAHGLVGGAVSVAQGGKFGHGFASSFLTVGLKEQLFETLDIGIETGTQYNVHRNVVAAAVGAISAAAVGGDVGLAAITSAIQNQFNANSEAGEYGYESPLSGHQSPPQQVEAINKLRKLVTRAQETVDRQIDCGFFCRNFSSRTFKAQRGTRIHSEFSRLVKSELGTNFSVEVSYLEGEVATYGTKGSSRADAVYGDPENPEFVIELKTGGEHNMSNREIQRYFSNKPEDTDLYYLFP